MYALDSASGFGDPVSPCVPHCLHEGGAAVTESTARTPSRRPLHPQRVYVERLEAALRPETRWLDLGCGRTTVPRWLPEYAATQERLRNRSHGTVGIDLDISALRENTCCAHRLQATADEIPFASGSFDLVTSNMVFEHVADPGRTLKEIRRVLQPGGLLLIHTANSTDFVAISARLIPNRFHQFVVSRIEGRAEEDVYPTYYRFNRAGRVRRLLRRAGLLALRIEHLEQPLTFQEVPVLAAVERIWQRWARICPALRGTLLVEATPEV